MNAYIMIEALNNQGLKEYVNFKVWRGSNWNDIHSIELKGATIWNK